MQWINPDCLPETKGNVERVLVNPDGEVDGVILHGAIDAALVHVPPHLSAEIEAGIQVGDAVRVHGVRVRRTSMMAAVALTDS
jgi:carbonic anhydrase/acetyltransferase-like protein (isoleucine patch superfamily)